MLRKCVDCGREAHTTKDLDYFCKNKSSTYGHENHCKKCNNSLYRDPLKYKASSDRSTKKWNPINDPKKIRFLGKLILLKENPRTNVCTKCGSGYPDDLKRQTVMHHEKYDQGNPTKHTRELCQSCHIKLLSRDSQGRLLPQGIMKVK